MAPLGFQWVWNHRKMEFQGCRSVEMSPPGSVGAQRIGLVWAWWEGAGLPSWGVHGFCSLVVWGQQ